MASNILNDPMGPIMQAYRDKQRQNLPTEITIVEKHTSSLKEGKDTGVNQLNSKYIIMSPLKRLCKLTRKIKLMTML